MSQFTCKQGDDFVVGDNIRITVMNVAGDKVELCTSKDRHVPTKHTDRWQQINEYWENIDQLIADSEEDGVQPTEDTKAT